MGWGCSVWFLGWVLVSDWCFLVCLAWRCNMVSVKLADVAADVEAVLAWTVAG